ncbi:MAG: putative RNA methyltransferase [Hyphomonadaceae bacterium]
MRPTISTPELPSAKEIPTPGFVASGLVACPICAAAMADHAGRALACPSGHSFDRAREGYYNLLVVQHKASRDPGDSKPMVAARRHILDAGIYAPLAEQVSARIAELARGREDFAVLDAGCGEGYYLNVIAAALKADGLEGCRLAGIDISKWAVQAAAKRNRNIFWAVESNKRIPFTQPCLDLIVCMFGFPVWDAFAAAQPSGGHVLLVDPAPDHLIELRAIIYPMVELAEGQGSLDAAERAGYRLADQQRVTFTADLFGQAQIADLLAMTPHDHRATQAGRESLAAREHLTVTVDVAIRLLSKP